MAGVKLSPDAISMLSTGDVQPADFKPIVQVIDIGIIPPETPIGDSGNNKERYCVLLSDGDYHQKGMLAVQLNDLVTSQQLQKGSIVHLTDYACMIIREHLITIILDLDVIHDNCDIIGNAKPFPLNFPTIKTPSMSKGFISKRYTLKTVSQIKDDKLGTSEKPDWITVNATIWYINLENFCYMECPIMLGDRKCSKRILNNGDRTWRCDSCDQIVDECDYSYILKLQIRDHTGLTWITAFKEVVEEIMGVSAKDLYVMKHEEKDEDRLIETLRGVLLGKYNFQLKVKEEFLVDEVRVISSVVKAVKIK